MTDIYMNKSTYNTYTLGMFETLCFISIDQSTRNNGIIWLLEDEVLYYYVWDSNTRSIVRKRVWPT